MHDGRRLHRHLLRAQEPGTDQVGIRGRRETVGRQVHRPPQHQEEPREAPHMPQLLRPQTPTRHQPRRRSLHLLLQRGPLRGAGVRLPTAQPVAQLLQPHKRRLQDDGRPTQTRVRERIPRLRPPIPERPGKSHRRDQPRQDHPNPHHEQTVVQTTIRKNNHNQRRRNNKNKLERLRIYLIIRDHSCPQAEPFSIIRRKSYIYLK